MAPEKKSAPDAGRGGAGATSATGLSVSHNETKVNIKSRLREYLRIKGIEPNQGGRIPCPFHDEKTPSCKVNDEYVHCFSCGEGGDIYRVAAALLGVPCDREHFREIAAEVEKTLGIPEWEPLPRSRRGPPGHKLSKSVIYRDLLLKEFAGAIDSGDMGTAYHKACLLFALFLLPEEFNG